MALAQFSEENKKEKPKRKRGRPSKRDLEQRAASTASEDEGVPLE